MTDCNINKEIILCYLKYILLYTLKVLNVNNFKKIVKISYTEPLKNFAVRRNIFLISYNKFLFNM